MIAGIGVDMVRIERIRHSFEQFGDRFAAKILSSTEMERLARTRNQVAWLAKRFAAKEAAAKALGTGMRGGVHFSQIVVGKKKSGAPTLSFTGAAEARAHQIGVTGAYVSISDEAEYTVAFVVLETD